jgi:hypothetical protein
MLYNIDSFVNSNASNFEGSLDEFVSQFSYTVCNEQAFPVLVYEREGSAVAWYDEELECGFVA